MKEATTIAWHPARLQQFIRGQITLGELQGVSKKEPHRIAELGHRFLSEGKLDNATKIFEGLIALDPHDDYAFTALGAIAQQRGELEVAEELYARAIALNPTSSIAHARRGEVLAALGRSKEAGQDLLRAIELDGELRAAQRAKAALAALGSQLAKQ